MNQERLFSSKLLLFGEHILLKGASAVAVPAPAFSGFWANTATAESDYARNLFRQSVDKLSRNLPLDFTKIFLDLDQGWYFNSNIPQGYGLGSSGAFCAALLHRYGGDLSKMENAQLRVILAQLESSFHGKSSGIDPLTSYLDGPLLFKSDDIQLLGPDYMPSDGISVFLLDTQQVRRTEKLVNWFLETYHETASASRIQDELLPIHEIMVSTWLEGDTTVFMEKLKWVSGWQWFNFEPMRPASENLQALWMEALGTDHTYLKICGAGGGGFVLGFSTDKSWILERSNQLGLRVIFPFDRT